MLCQDILPTLCLCHSPLALADVPSCSAVAAITATAAPQHTPWPCLPLPAYTPSPTKLRAPYCLAQIPTVAAPTVAWHFMCGHERLSYVVPCTLHAVAMPPVVCPALASTHEYPRLCLASLLLAPWLLPCPVHRRPHSCQGVYQHARAHVSCTAPLIPHSSCSTDVPPSSSPCCISIVRTTVASSPWPRHHCIPVCRFPFA